MDFWPRHDLLVLLFHSSTKGVANGGVLEKMQMLIRGWSQTSKYSWLASGCGQQSVGLLPGTVLPGGWAPPNSPAPLLFKPEFNRKKTAVRTRAFALRALPVPSSSAPPRLGRSRGRIDARIPRINAEACWGILGQGQM